MRSTVLGLFAMGLVGCTATSGDDGDTGGEGQTIGPAGGTLMSADGKLEIIIPPNAIAETTVTITESFDGPASIGEAYRVTPVTELSLDATVLYHFDAAQVEGRDIPDLNIATDVGGAWEGLDRVSVDEGTMTVTCTDRELAFRYGLIVDPEAGDSHGDSGTDTGTGTGDDTGTTDAPTTGAPTSDSGSDTSSGTDGTTSMGDTGSGSDSGSDDGNPPSCGNGVGEAGEVCLLEGFSISSGSAPSGIVVADFDGDGDMDFAVAHELDDTVGVRFGNGSGFFTAPDLYPVGDGPTALHLVDLGGGGLDIVVANGSAGSVSVLTGDGAGDFSVGTPIAVGNMPSDVTTGDFDEDLTLDIVTANAATDDVSWLSGGVGPAVSFPVGFGAVGVDQGDFNADGNLDLAVANAGGAVSLLAGNGAGLFGAASNTTVPGMATDLVVADLNGDGLLDVVVTSSTGVATVLLGNGLGGFGGGVPYATGAGPVAVELADIDGDGELDLLVVNGGAGTVDVLLGTGAGGFGSAHTFVVGASPTGVGMADFTGDGVPDLVVSNAGDDDVSLLVSDP